MFTIEFEIVLVIAAFILGATEGANIWAWIKSWFVKEEQAVVTKVESVVGIHPTGPSGATGAH